jgi:NAD(P)H-nitrite reductase large subunit
VLFDYQFIAASSLKTHIKSLYAMGECAKRNEVNAGLGIGEHRIESNATT